MGKEANLKALRKQLRVVIREAMPDVLSNEMVAAVRKEIGAKVDTGLAALNKAVTDKLNEIDNRSKDLQNSFVRGTLSKPLEAAGLVPLPTRAEEPAATDPVQE